MMRLLVLILLLMPTYVLAWNLDYIQPPIGLKEDLGVEKKRLSTFSYKEAMQCECVDDVDCGANSFCLSSGLCSGRGMCSTDGCVCNDSTDCVGGAACNSRGYCTFLESQIAAPCSEEGGHYQSYIQTQWDVAVSNIRALATQNSIDAPKLGQSDKDVMALFVQMTERGILTEDIHRSLQIMHRFHVASQHKQPKKVRKDVTGSFLAVVNKVDIFVQSRLSK